MTRRMIDLVHINIINVHNILLHESLHDQTEEIEHEINVSTS